MGIKDFYNKAKKNVLKVFGYRLPETLEELKALVNDPKVDLGKIDVSKVTSFEGLFKNSTRTDFSGIEKWNVSHVTNMRQMFYNAKFFNADIGGWDVSHVTAMSQMFYKAKSFSQDLGSWDMSGMKGHLNGRFLNNMFKHADKMNQRVFNEYMELGKQNIVPEERFNFLSVPRPRDYKKLIVPHTSNDVKEIFERLDDFAEMDTSAVTSLDHVLEDSKKSHLKELDSLDLSSVKSANCLGKNAENLNQKIPDLPDVMYANEVLKGATSYQQPVPKMDQVKQMDGLLADVPDYAGEIVESLKDANPKFVNNIFNQVDKSHLLKEIAKLPKDSKITASIVGDITKMVDIYRLFQLQGRGDDEKRVFGYRNDAPTVKNRISPDHDKEWKEVYEKFKEVNSDKFVFLQMPTNTFNELKSIKPDFPGLEIYKTKADQYSTEHVFDPVILDKLQKNNSDLNTSFILVDKKEYNSFLENNPNLKVHNSLATLDNKAIGLDRACIKVGGELGTTYCDLGSLCEIINPSPKNSILNAKEWKIPFTNDYMRLPENLYDRALDQVKKESLSIIKNNKEVDLTKLAENSYRKTFNHICGEPILCEYINGKQYRDIDNFSFKEFNEKHPDKKISSNDLNELYKNHQLLTDDKNGNGEIQYQVPNWVGGRDDEAYSKTVRSTYSFDRFSELLNKKGVSDIIKKASQTTKIEEKKSHGRGR